jgi:hypothetical protein
MKEIILNKFTSPTLPNFINGFEYKLDFKFNFILLLTKTFLLVFSFLFSYCIFHDIAINNNY